jgi:hypothetical protein
MLRTGLAGYVAGSPDDGQHAEQRGQRDDQRDEVGRGKVAQGVEGSGESDDQHGDGHQPPSVQEHPRREGRRGSRHVRHGGDGLGGAAFGHALTHPGGDRQVARLVGDQEQLVGMGRVGGLCHRAAAGRP